MHVNELGLLEAASSGELVKRYGCRLVPADGA
jgi:hypothetical protein